MKPVDPFREARVCDCGDHGFVGLTRGATALFSPSDVRLVGAHQWYLLRRAGGLRVFERLIRHPTEFTGIAEALDVTVRDLRQRINLLTADGRFGKPMVLAELKRRTA